LRFADRKEYIDCDHPGSSDRYYLHLLTNITKTNNTVAVNDFRWEEKFSPGGF